MAHAHEVSHMVVTLHVLGIGDALLYRATLAHNPSGITRRHDHP